MDKRGLASSTLFAPSKFGFLCRNFCLVFLVVATRLAVGNEGVD